MRDINRIYKFCNELAVIWSENCPDYRFSQLVESVYSKIPEDPFYVEEEKMMEYIKNYFKKTDRGEENGIN